MTRIPGEVMAARLGRGFGAVLAFGAIRAVATACVAGLALVSVASSVAPAAPMPSPPCGVPPWPAHAPPDEPPAVAVWRDGVLEAGGWRPPACTGWRSDARSRVVVALAGRFALEGGADALLARAAAVSAMRGLRYWSVRDGAWHTLVREAEALSGSGRDAVPRPDFGVAELSDGQARVYRVTERRAGTVRYAMRLLERGPERLVLSIENVSAVRILGLPLFEPGALQTVLFAERDPRSAWRLYLLSRVDLQGGSVLAGETEASVANRGLALLRYLADVPSDRDPPAIR